MGQTDVLWVRQCNFYPQSHLCCEEKPLTAPSGVVCHCACVYHWAHLLENRQKRALNAKRSV